MLAWTMARLRPARVAAVGVGMLQGARLLAHGLAVEPAGALQKDRRRQDERESVEAGGPLEAALPYDLTACAGE